jgi:hypothetical protein
LFDIPRGAPYLEPSGSGIPSWESSRTPGAHGEPSLGDLTFEFAEGSPPPMLSCLEPVVALLSIAIAPPWETSAAKVDPLRLPPSASRKVDFHRDVHPLLAVHCFRCHEGIPDLSVSSGARSSAHQLLALGDVVK